MGTHTHTRTWTQEEKRQESIATALVVARACQYPSRESSLAITKLEEALMWGETDCRKKRESSD